MTVRAHARAAAAAAALLLGVAGAQAQPAGDAGRGRTLYESRCVACHSVDAHRVGPAHRGVVGRKAGGAAGYDYSPALSASRVRWEASTLEAWLTDPERLIPGQKMGYRVEVQQDRADLIAYLASLK